MLQIKSRFVLAEKNFGVRCTLSTMFIFVSCKEKDYYRFASVGQFGLTAVRTAGAATVGVKQIIFSQFLSIFESGGITKHLMTGPSGNSEFSFPPTSVLH